MKILKKVFDDIICHAKIEAPLEACGYLASNGAVVAASYALTNVDRSGEHFSFDPEEQFAAVREARTNGLGITAVYHSHTVSPARPSQEDIKLAYDPDMIYVIISLANVKEEVKAFMIKNGKVDSVDLEIINDKRI